MRIVKLLVPVLLIIMLVAGCGGSKEAAPPPASDVPDWYLNPPSDPNFLFAAKSAPSADMQLAIEKATAEARADISRQMEVRVQSLVKKFDEEVGTGNDTQLLSQFTSASKQVTSNVLNGSKVKQQKVGHEGNGYRAYVLMQLPIGAAADQLLESMKKNNQTYTRFRATETFKELDDEAKKYEDFKKSEGQ
ncbi:MAG TPA: LPP20 family lipoprotein [Bacteroidota bacterium]|nr:LPP20 family lipoprotein [Bacteroidota bacterium]